MDDPGAVPRDTDRFAGSAGGNRLSARGMSREPTHVTTAGKGAPRLPYMPGVDGLRALAVSAVLVYHLGAAWLPGGFLGVDVFFVISGFLITSLLLVEYRKRERIDLVRFWTRRALRLFPAIVVMIAVVLLAMIVLHPGEVARTRGPVLASLGYVANWYFVFADVPYFEQFGRQSVFLHMWSLAVEEQFYLLWPPILLASLAVARIRGVLIGVALAVAASAVAAWVLWEPFTDPSRIYYGTDTRAVGLLAGVLLALAWPVGKRAVALGARPRALMEALGLMSLGLLAVAFLTLGELDERLYRGGFLAVGVVTAGLIAAVAHPQTAIGRAFGTPVPLWIGLRSYGIYLWHWPVIMLTRPNVDVPFDGAPLVAFRLALIVGAAALSYRFVEVPIRRAGVQGIKDALFGPGAKLSKPLRVAAGSAGACLVVGLALAVALLPATNASVPGLTDQASAAARETTSDTPTEKPADTPTESAPLLFVGDSVMLGAREELKGAFGERAVVDAEVGRGFADGSEVVIGHLRRLPDDTIVVIHLGNNTFIDPAELRNLMERLARRPRVMLLTVRVPLPWQDSVNETVREVAEERSNVTVLDWHARSGEPGLLVDGAHMSADGMRVYSDVIREALGEAPA